MAHVNTKRPTWILGVYNVLRTYPRFYKSSSRTNPNRAHPCCDRCMLQLPSTPSPRGGWQPMGDDREPPGCRSQGTPVLAVGKLKASAGGAHQGAMLPGTGRAPGPWGFIWQGHTNPTAALLSSSPAQYNSVLHLHFCLAELFFCLFGLLCFQNSSGNSLVTV